MPERYRYVRFGEDIGLESTGDSQVTAFIHAATGLFALHAHPATVLAERQVHVEFDQPDPTLALAEWLNRLLAQADLAGLVLAGFALTRNGDHYLGHAWGMPWKPARHRGPQVREVRPDDLEVIAMDTGWRTRCRLALRA